MKSLIPAILMAAALPGTGFAHPGHIADTGQGHAHWPLYLLLGIALIAGAAWAYDAFIRSGRS